MGNDGDSNPAIEVRELSRSELAALAAELGVTIHALYNPALELCVAATESAALFEAAPPEVQRAVLQILRGVARKRSPPPTPQA